MIMSDASESFHFQPNDLPGYLAHIKALLKSAYQNEAKKSEFVTQHCAGSFIGPHQFCKRCGQLIAIIGENEPFSFPKDVAVFENCLGEMDTKARTLFRIPCQRPTREHENLEWAKITFVK